MIFRPSNKRLVYLSATVLWAGIIFYLSSVPDLASGLPSLFDLILRKLAHITEYFILTWLLIKTLGSVSKTKTTIALTIAVLYAISDEYHQSFVLGRNGNFQDLLIDSLGIFLSSFFFKQKTRRDERDELDKTTLGF